MLLISLLLKAPLFTSFILPVTIQFLLQRGHIFEGLNIQLIKLEKEQIKISKRVGERNREYKTK